MASGRGRAGLHIAHGKSPGLADPICNTQFICGAKSSDTYIHVHTYIYVICASCMTRWACSALQLLSEDMSAKVTSAREPGDDTRRYAPRPPLGNMFCTLPCVLPSTKFCINP